MKKILSNFADQLISKEQMKKIKGGCWCYSFTCSCGSSSFMGSADSVSGYTGIVQQYCTAGNPVNCNFTAC